MEGKRASSVELFFEFKEGLDSCLESISKLYGDGREYLSLASIDDKSFEVCEVPNSGNFWKNIRTGIMEGKFENGDLRLRKNYFDEGLEVVTAYVRTFCEEHNLRLLA